MGGTKVTVKLKFDNKHLVYIDLGSVVITCYDYGATEVSAPDEYISLEDKASVSGKTFVFSDMDSGEMSGEELSQAYAVAQSMTVQFNKDGTIVISYPAINQVLSGTYTQVGDKVTATITSITVNGAPMAGSESQLPMKIEGTFDGTFLTYRVMIGQAAVTAVLVVKTA